MGFDNGTLGHCIVSQVQQLGSILRGSGPPVPQAGIAGSLYVDVQTWFLYAKREAEGTDPWGNYLFQIPATYRASLKWFGGSLPGNDIGVDGDYCLLWAGFNNYGLQPSIFGPKVDGCWPESGDGPGLLLDPAYAGFTLPVGAVSEGQPIAYSASTQLIVAGATTEYILAIPVPQIANSPVYQVGVQSPPTAIAVDLNPTYSAENQHAV